MIKEETIDEITLSLDNHLRLDHAETCLILTGINIADNKHYEVTVNGYTNDMANAKMIAGFLRNNPEVKKQVKKMLRPEFFGGLGIAK